LPFYRRSGASDRPVRGDPLVIAGLSSTGIAGAIRTAGIARATMDTMTRQIATGQRVSSVKDDGAAWARAALLRGQASTTAVLADNLDRFANVLAINSAGREAILAQREQQRANALAATDPTLSAAARAALQASQTALSVSSSMAVASEAHGQLDNGGNPFQGHNGIGGQVRVTVGDQGQFVTYAIQPLALLPGTPNDLSTAASAAQDLARWDSELAYYTSRESYWGAVGNGLDRLNRHFKLEQDRIGGAIGSLTEADLGRASTQLRQSETRQQLALATINRAINAYGNFAGGLLGNVQRTQRGVLA
jgi:flagellin-like hook-associated protein FlgL